MCIIVIADDFDNLIYIILAYFSKIVNSNEYFIDTIDVSCRYYILTS